MLEQMANDLKRALGGPPAEQSRLVNGIVDVLFSRGPGVTGLIEMFKNKGLGNQASSWVSSGENLPISSTQIQQALGPELIQQIAAKTGLPPDTVIQKLSTALPTVVDKLTPEGKIPQDNILQQGLSFLRQQFSQESSPRS